MLNFFFNLSKNVCKYQIILYFEAINKYLQYGCHKLNGYYRKGKI